MPDVKQGRWAVRIDGDCVVFIIGAGEDEPIYGTMPQPALARAGELVPQSAGTTARRRLDNVG